MQRFLQAISCLVASVVSRGFEREIELTRQNQEFMAFLDERGKQTKTVSAAEARARLGLTSE